MGDAKKKVNISQGHRSYVTKLLKTSDELIRKGYQPAQELDQTLQQQKRILQERLDTLKALDEQILELVEDETKTATEIEEAADFNECMVKIDSILCLKQGKPDPVNQHPVLAATAGQSATKSTHLTKLVVKKFNGEAYQWQSFWDSFSSSVDTNESLSDVDKFNYLRSLCKQGAPSTIAGLALTNANYKVAVDLLKKRFGNVDVAINSHINRLLKLPQLNNSNDVRKLRVLYDSIEAHVRGLQALDVTNESYGKLMVPI